MIMLTDILKSKTKIHRLIKEWGFVAVANHGPQIYPDTKNLSTEATFCIVVKSDPNLVNANPNFIKNEELRQSYLEDELAIQLNCHLKVETKETTINTTIDLTADNKTIIEHFGKYQNFKDFDNRNLEEDILLNPDTLNAINEFKIQIAANKNKLP